MRPLGYKKDANFHHFYWDLQQFEFAGPLKKVSLNRCGSILELVRRLFKELNR